MRKSIYSKGQKQLQTLLKDARRHAGLTQQVVAKQLQRPQSFVAKYERGERRLDVVEFVEVARVLDADPIRLLRHLIRQSGL